VKFMQILIMSVVLNAHQQNAQHSDIPNDWVQRIWISTEVHPVPYH
jgi:hypothetical protein